MVATMSYILVLYFNTCHSALHEADINTYLDVTLCQFSFNLLCHVQFDKKRLIKGKCIGRFKLFCWQPLKFFFKLQILKKKEPKSITYYAYICTIYSGTHAMIFAEYSLSVGID